MKKNNPVIRIKGIEYLYYIRDIPYSQRDEDSIFQLIPKLKGELIVFKKTGFFRKRLYVEFMIPVK